MLLSVLIVWAIVYWLLIQSVGRGKILRGKPDPGEEHAVESFSLR